MLPLVHHLPPVAPVLAARPSFRLRRPGSLPWPCLNAPCPPARAQISVTSGVVSRIEVTAYAHGATELLGVQIDAAINSGNSGG